MSKVSTPTRGGDAFILRLTKNLRLDSSGLNLVFEGLLLGASLQPHAKDTCSDPHKSGFQFMMLLLVQKECLSSFTGSRRCRRSTKRRQQMADKTEACEIAWTETKSQRYCHRWLGEGHNVDACTWQHLVGVSKSDLVL
jgi:hypothetical protein